MIVKKPVKKNGAKSLRSLQSLSNALDISISDLNAAINIPVEKRYHRLELSKVNGEKRIVFDPDHRVRKIQRRINKRIFKELILWPEYLFGSIPTNQSDKENKIERHYIACAAKHCKAKTILKLDIKNFFENIHRDIVVSIFSDVFQYKGEALKYLVDICCYNEYIVQGALTSSYIASLCLFDVEYDVFRRAERKGLVYTRLVDDITISSRVVDYDMAQIKSHVENMLNEKDLPINQKKTEVHNISTEALTVHGLRVSFNEPRLASNEVKRIKASVHNIVNLSQKNNSKTSEAYRIEYNRCMGRVNKLGRVGHNKYKLLLDTLKKIKPKASLLDLQSVHKLVGELEKLHVKGSYNEFEFKRKYNLAVFKLIVINRTDSYKPFSDWIKSRLEKIKPC
ncbi:TPA: RNA-directed DNA polymerase [Yersinia enterocolitica]|nr:RNA-directed DNA polymerase [Yersinia enterocolitica]HDL8028086.1 RNA-directed DNA polymerase [Yersinia enterocolitica]HDL8160955.1 RNA-directed DNA polymerase [Yersinia enterocolitica]HDL8164801.1 RNA-directed DNA polymerase [Yersinia enterocolitica]HDL8168066.1 RNA-directed DNA polymerase [Yersinia enterocolitica]